MITETKLDDSLSTCNSIYVQDEFPSKFIPMKNFTIEGFFIELNLRKRNDFYFVLIILTDVSFRII